MATKTTKSTPKRATSQKKANPKKVKVTAKTVQERAVQIYLARLQAGTPGDELSDWLQAEKELNSI